MESHGLWLSELLMSVISACTRIRLSWMHPDGCSQPTTHLLRLLHNQPVGLSVLLLLSA